MYQCVENLKAGDSVQYENKLHRVQNDKGWLFIQVTENGKRKKIDACRLVFKCGSEADYIFNGWFQIYSSYELYHSFISAELSWVSL